MLEKRDYRISFSKAIVHFNTKYGMSLTILDYYISTYKYPFYFLIFQNLYLFSFFPFNLHITSIYDTYKDEINLGPYLGWDLRHLPKYPKG